MASEVEHNSFKHYNRWAAITLTMETGIIRKHIKNKLNWDQLKRRSSIWKISHYSNEGNFFNAKSKIFIGYTLVMFTYLYTKIENKKRETYY